MKKLLLCLLMGVMCFCLTGCGDTELEKAQKELEEAQKELEEAYQKYGWVEQESVDTLIGKFNAQIIDNSSLNYASNDYLTIGENDYWYGLIEGIYLVVIPEEFKNDKTDEIVDYMVIYVDKTSKYVGDVLDYVKYLVKANNNEISDTQIETLIKEAKEKSSSQDVSYNGSGITMGYVEDDESYQYQVIRMYK